MSSDSIRKKEWQLFTSTFLISAFTVGGGFVIAPLLKAKFVDEYHWLEDKEALDMVSIAQASPGVVAVNAAIILGYKISGMRGLFIALFATVLPPLIFLSIIAFFYTQFITNPYIKMVLRGMQCGATAAIISVFLDLLKKEWRKKLVLPLAIMIYTFCGSCFFDVPVMYLVIGNAILGFFLLRDAKYD